MVQVENLTKYYGSYIGIEDVSFSIEAGGIVRVRYTLAPADASAYWILDQVGASELDQSTRLAYA